MSPDELKQALLQAQREHMKKTFGVLVDNLITDQADAEKRFENAIRLNKRAFAIATDVCTKLLEDGS